MTVRCLCLVARDGVVINMSQERAILCVRPCMRQVAHRPRAGEEAGRGREKALVSSVI